MKWFTYCVAIAVVGCSAPVAAPKPVVPLGAPAKIDLQALLEQHPFAGDLAQYTRDVATLQHAHTFAAFADMDRRLGTNAAALAHERANGEMHVRSLRTRDTLTQPAGVNDASGGDRLGGGAAYVRALDAGVVRAYELRAAQLREHETTVAYDFERAHALQRLQLRLKVAVQRLDAAKRAAYARQLTQLDAREAAIVAAERQRDDLTLARYAGELHVHAQQNAAAMANALAQHQRAIRGLAALRTSALPAVLLHPPDERAQTVAAFQRVGSDLSAQFARLRDRDGIAYGSTRAEIVALTRERDRLREQMIVSIERIARRIADAHHLGAIYTEHAPAGARDLTQDVLAAERSQT